MVAYQSQGKIGFPQLSHQQQLFLRGIPDLNTYHAHERARARWDKK